MATEVPSQQELYELFKNEAQARNPGLTDFNDGSNLDAIGGGLSVVGQELVAIILNQFSKTFIDTSNGPDFTGGPDDLQNLLVDHFGDSFARPAATPAIGTVTFTRPTFGAGAITIPAGSVVKTEKDADGNEQRFLTDSAVILGAASLTVDASVTAAEPGAAGNVLASKVIVIETALLDDTITVDNLTGFVGGDDETDDSEYRDFARNKIEIIRGATCAAIEAAALNVSGVETATTVEDVLDVIGWDIGSSMTTGDNFKISRARLFVADVNGVASDALISAVEEAIFIVRACGVNVIVEAAVALPIDWTARLTLNPAGPNFAELSTDTTLVEESMAQYIRDLPIGSDFNRALARLAILDIWGPTGTNDLTDFITDVPTGDLSATEVEKLVPGTVEASQ